MRKLLAPMIALLVVAFIITGCSTASTSTSQPAITSPSTTVTAPALTSTSQPAGITTSTTTPTPTSSSKYGGTLKWIDPSAPGSPIGASWLSPFASGSMQLSYEPLLWELANGTLDPKLATSFDVDNSLQNPSITLHLRQGVKFSDGTDFNAQAVQWNFQKLQQSHLWAAMSYYKSFDVIDNYTIKLPMTIWQNSLLPAFAFNESYMVSPTAYEKNGLDWLDWHMVGTGPFLQTDYKQDVSLTTSRNPNYWQTGKPYLDGVQYLFVPDSMTAEALFESGGAQVLNTAGNAQVASQLAGKGYNVINETNDASSLVPDSADADSPWSNLEVREAAEYAIDKTAIAKAFGYGYWQAADQAASPSAPAYVASITGRNYDVTKAKQLLADAGYPNGFKTRIIAQNTVNQNVLLAIQSYFAKVGIQASLELDEFPKIVSYQSSGWDNGLLFTPMQFEGYIMPSLGFNFHPQRTGRYTVVKDPPNWVQLFDTSNSAATADPTSLKPFIQSIYDYSMFIPIYWEPNMWVTTNNLQDSGIGTLTSQYWNPQDAWFSK